ncbi:MULTISPECIES: (2,3-dihydroxybenzoyl)adenylate synthase [Oceanobacillus]|uniref:2,3-dihydroxybenzoate-AMP ligase n=1 Tax=Oceanobacillus kimchii TaxID=746691 RepID=A0ABQ5TI96_9BACI|nr:MULTISPECIES: (2,3-dihydroxybenzoyl)adenylate synthase [Oceanobacillus]MBT2599339.1 (2,3-dihydroxybenzoyl)adenylate synthase [Oceanobacillus sp. ISL-74]MBT2652257.1 (2,3-dihydroxybenzoyl)adenylate synthase [Oceanobacillus sp. ISL-73]MCT1578464.1 (2,3-dihydroxybenzoyl)adenylate synthase [Oceanobacillus kimchii]MCT2136487.1 (2,3-dihydroxybenzoyl)adenylate synthase [Oceanobacillus kimchii]OEH54106.1 2,3-dihydroxybenzoate-AMP ligase [Oceanobacillus sp. E9]
MLEGYKPWPESLRKYYQETGCWTGETFGGILEKQARDRKDSVVITDGEKSITYQRLDERVNKLAVGFMNLGIEKEDRVVLQLPNTIEFFEVCFALFRIGALPIFALPLHRKMEISYFCEFTEAKAYIIPDVYDNFDYRNLANEINSSIPTLEHTIVAGETERFTSLEKLYIDKQVSFPAITGSDLAFFQLSGGSTGLPKLIPRTHDEYIYSLRKSVEICRLSQDTNFLAVLPVAHNFTMSSPGVFGVIYAGGKIILSKYPSPDVAFPLIEKEKVDFTSLVPPLAIVWLQAQKRTKADLSSLKVIQVGGAKCSAEIAKQIKPAFNCKLQQVFGMAEGLVNYTRLDDDDEVIIHTQGKPMSEYDEIRIVDEEDNELPVGETGQLQARGPYTIIGYFNVEEHNAKAFTSDGFYRTGDVVKLTEEGYLIVEGRDKDQINRGGEKIAAEEVENYILSLPGVHDVAIVSMPDKFLGERSCAFVIKNKEELTVNDIKDFLQHKGIANFKIPDRIEFVDRFPYTALGKVSKKNLRAMIKEKLTQKSY